jgi:vacuolar protein sorting-associated protein 13A/C
MDIRTEETTQVLVFKDYREEDSVFKVQRRPSEALSRQNSMSSTRDVQFEAVATEAVTTFSFNLDLAGVGISVVDRKLRELVYVSFRGLKVDYKDQTDRQSVGVVCQWIQIDNQLRDSLFPIILYPTRAPKDEADLQAHPNLQLSVMLLKDQGVPLPRRATRD